MALGLVLWAIVIGSALLAVAVFIGALERRAAGTGRHLERAMTRAETRRPIMASRARSDTGTPPESR